MSWPSDVKGFFRSKAGSAFTFFALFCAALSAGVGYGTYSLALSAYIADKGEEKKTALQLVDAFVKNYADLRAGLGSAAAPVPATFRAHSIELFNRIRHADDVLRMVWVGRTGRSIATPPLDAAMAETIESFSREAHPEPQARFLIGPSGPVFRTVYPSVASEQSCVDCHNRLQPDQHWRLNEVMGAFGIDAPAGPFLRRDLLQSAGVGCALFFALAAVGLATAILYFRRQREREANLAVLHQAKEEAETASRSKTEFLATMSHELRTPLNAVIGFADLMRSEACGKLGDGYLDYATDIHRSGVQLLGIINDILELAKLDAGRMTLREEPVDLAELCARAVAAARSHALETRITVELATPSTDTVVRADEQLLKKALTNLLSNAVKFSRPGGTVEVSLALGPTVAIRVVGLGLPLAKAIVALHGGDLAIESTLDIGTTATIHLPATRLCAVPAVPHRPSSLTVTEPALAAS
jgi:signal transduction histidine kinase